MSLRILFLEPQPCIRALKYARGLKWALNDKVSITFGYLFYTLNELYGHGDGVFDELVKLNPDNLARARLSKMDCLVGAGGWCELCLRVGSH